MSNLYHEWLKSDKITEIEKSELRKLSPEQQEAYFKTENLQFGTAGIRAVMGLGTKRLNRFTYGQIFHAFATYIKNSFKFGQSITVIIGHDNRLDGDNFSLLGAKILNHYGIRVLLFKKNTLIPTPIISYAIRELGCNAGINITASHNPKEFNGIKLYTASGGQITTQDVPISKLFCPPHEIINVGLNYELTNTEYLNDEIIRRYFHDARNVEIDHTAIHRSDKKIPFVICTNQGAASKLLPKYIKFLGYKKCKIVRDQAIIDPYFSNTECANPESEESFKKSYILADKIGATFCIGVDPDADRMAISVKKDGKWNLLSGNETGTIFVYYTLMNRKIAFNKPYIVASSVTTNVIDHIAKKFNADVIRTGTGFKWMGDVVTRYQTGHSLVAAFEESIGALLSPINRDKDSFTATTLILEIITKYKQKGMDLIDLLQKEIYPQYGYNYARTVSYTFDILDFLPFLEGKMNLFRKYKSNTIGKWHIYSNKWNEVGECIEWDLGNDNWVKFRKSGTEPKFKAYFCIYGTSNFDAKKQFDDLKILIDQIVNNKPATPTLVPPTNPTPAPTK
ncbi:MAG: phospho-sugar mutase [Mycoplasmataceae bacterium]|nr:phospho-sugar mutase [Mycoplasmataceae bacterium]